MSKEDESWPHEKWGKYDSSGKMLETTDWEFGDACVSVLKGFGEYLS